jgi:aspartyl-tRNA(Asn)/glutamyl-tRNA(Gln) amidotransferase subunit C
MSVIDRAQVRHVAVLAELELTEAEEEKLAGELARIVDYVAELDAIDTSDVPPTAVVSHGRAALRGDVPEPSLSNEEALAAAPNAQHGGFSVPTFIE